jgi:glycerophosphoryl diester phosphodiesterase
MQWRPVDVKPRVTPRVRWRRRALVVLGVVAVAYAALWIVRLTRDYVPVPERAFLRGGPLVFAHRGASALRTEHTVPAYRRALADGADVLELDLHLSGDGVIVVSHDRDLARALDVPLAIAGHELGALRAAVAARHPLDDPAALLPTLEDVMAGFPAARLNLELKADSAALAAAVAATIDRHGAVDRVLVASFHRGGLEAFRAAAGGRVATAAAPGEGARFYLCYLLEVPCRPAFEALQIPTRLRSSWPRMRLDDEDFISFAHRHGLKVHYWTIDDEAVMARLLRAGADGIMTNDPARAVRVRRELGR